MTDSGAGAHGSVARIGLTGGIGSGKSTVAQLLVQCGACLVDTDAIARALTQRGGAAMPALAAEFGTVALAEDGSLNRAQMRQRAFADPASRRRLEAILHPLIAAESWHQAGQAAGQVVVFDVPLLAESRHWRERVDRVLVVDCDEATQVRRVTQRPGWSEPAARAVMAQQASRAARRAVADAVICNDQMGLEALRREVLALWALWNNPC